MVDSDDPRYIYEKERERIENDLEGDALAQVLEFLDAADPQERRPKFEHDGEVTELSSNSLKTYGARLRYLTMEVGRPLLDLTNDEIDDLMDGLIDGSAGISPDDGYSTSWVQQSQTALIAFYRYHDGHGVDPDKVPMEKQEKSSVDERDLWTVEEVESLRAHIDSKRNEALFELLAYTGQRIRVIQTLRVKDVDPDKGETGRYYVNGEVEGRKNRDGHGPLLGAQSAVRRWLRVHPTKKADDNLITALPENGGGGVPGKPLGQTSIRRALESIAERAGVEKGINPHMFRHYFSTVTLRPEERGGFGMDVQYVRRLRGDAPGSNVLETTYAHLIDEDASAHAESSFSDGEEGNALTPAAPCGTCGEMLNAGDKACPNCGHRRALVEKSELEQMLGKMERLAEEMGIDVSDV